MHSVLSMKSGCSIKCDQIANSLIRIRADLKEISISYLTEPTLTEFIYTSRKKIDKSHCGVREKS